MRILITGAAGYLGRGMWPIFEKAGHALRLMDVAPFESSHETVIGSVTDLDACRQAVAGVDGILIAHMAPRKPDAYLTPVVSFDINVKGTANLFHAAVEHHVNRVVLISSTGATAGHRTDPEQPVLPHTTPPKSLGMYGLTKALQEIIAEQFAREHHISTSVLRMPHIMDQDSLVDKYGKKHTNFSPHFTDRRDIAEAARLCLERPDITYEVFNVLSTDDALARFDVQHTCDFLHWKPQYPFHNIPKKNTT